jgi:uncharacterized protein YjbJ (UPF0337 family)
MNWDQLHGKWQQMRGSMRQQWGKLTDNDLEQINGNRDRLIGILQERYGIAKEDAQRRADEWITTLKETETEQPRTFTGGRS